MLLIYVDDIIAGNSSQISKFISNLVLVFNMKDLGELHYFLGIQVTRDQSTITLTQTRYVPSLPWEFGLDGAKPITTPLATGAPLPAIEGALLLDPSLYRQMAGLIPIYDLKSLLYVNPCKVPETLLFLWHTSQIMIK